MVKTIPHKDIIAFDDFVSSHPIVIDVVYAQEKHPDNIFKQAIYSRQTKLWGHKDMVHITLDAANICFKEHGWILEIKDCLRPIEAQAIMLETAIVKSNPQWIEDPRLLSPPGRGGHPRGMAVDIIPLTKGGKQIDMGTAFDYLTDDKTNNPAARNYTNLSKEVLENRDKLTNAMLESANNAGMELLPLPQEWWDFRFMPDYSNQFAPIANVDLPEEMQFVLD